MQITINNIPVEVQQGETLIEVARRMGHAIPSMCYAKGARHKSSCMVCAVKNSSNGQIIPSCTTLPTEGMKIETACEEVKQVRVLSLELLLSDHRADCEAPCSLVCPQGLDIERMLSFYDAARYKEAHALLASVFALPDIACNTCKAPCEKACRRGTVDKTVEIRGIIKEIASYNSTPNDSAATPPLQGGGAPTGRRGRGQGVCDEPKASINTPYLSRLGRFTPKEKERLQQTVVTPSRCLHCACAGRTGCKLREYATTAGIKRPRYEASSALPAMNRQHINGDLWFEQAKCIRCGICVYNTNNAFTFKDRGFGMQIVIPAENRSHVSEEIAERCPTGALYTLASTASREYDSAALKGCDRAATPPLQGGGAPTGRRGLPEREQGVCDSAALRECDRAASPLERGQGVCDEPKASEINYKTL